MHEIFVNLKRFDIPRSRGGVCPVDSPVDWIKGVIEETVASGLGDREDLRLVYLLPEALIPSGCAELAAAEDAGSSIFIGCQGVFREDVRKGGNFGAFTTNLPASAAVGLGCSWAIIGHSEERRDKLGIIEAYQKGAGESPEAHAAVNRLIGEEVNRALEARLNVLLCIGENQDQKERVDQVLAQQLALCLEGAAPRKGKASIVVGYEPIWAIGPGKTPPGADYIRPIAIHIKETVERLYEFSPSVVYGGGLKAENAAMLGGIAAVDGGLVALTRFTGDIGFEVAGLSTIIDRYAEARSGK